MCLDVICFILCSSFTESLPVSLGAIVYVWQIITIQCQATDFVSLSPFLLPQISYSFHHVATGRYKRNSNKTKPLNKNKNKTKKKRERTKEGCCISETLESLGGKSVQWIHSWADRDTFSQHWVRHTNREECRQEIKHLQSALLLAGAEESSPQWIFFNKPLWSC